jgi:hypothetical protein
MADKPPSPIPRQPSLEVDSRSLRCSSIGRNATEINADGRFPERLRASDIRAWRLESRARRKVLRGIYRGICDLQSRRQACAVLFKVALQCIREKDKRQESSAP